MATKKPYIQIIKKEYGNAYFQWILVAGNSQTIAESAKTWCKIKPCRSSAHRAGIVLGLEVKNEK